MKKNLLPIVLASASLLSLTLTACGGSNDAPNGVVNVYNWGEYIDMSVLDNFTAETGIKVNYQTFDTNESMYGKIAGGSGGYDVLIPSDYMIGQLIDEDMLAPINFDNVPNFADISDDLKNLDYDPEGLYSVPYMYGTLGIIYNTTMVAEDADVESWDILWDETYANDILMFNNSRDTIGIALKKLGYSYNSTNPAEITEAVDLLIQQKPLVQAYVMDDIFEKLEAGNAAIGVYYYGDFLTMEENNPDLAFAIPREGSNLYVDAMVIPVDAQNKDNAETFINFMSSTEAGVMNCEEIWYSSPLMSVRDELDAEMVEDEFAYPEADVMAMLESFACLPSETRALYSSEWVRLMNA